MKKRVLCAALVTAVLSAGVSAQPKLEIVASWNALPYLIKDNAIQERWYKSPIYGKALMQGVKVDQNENIYVSTARWGGADIPATLSKLKKINGEYVLTAFPSEVLNDVNNPKGLKAVLGFEVDRNNVMWILDQGHVAGKPSKLGDEKLVLWDLNKNKEIQRYNFSDADTNKKCSFLNDVVVDNDSDFAYITDSGIFCNPLNGGLIVYDKANNKSRRILSGTKFTNNEENYFFNINGEPVLTNSPMLTGADGIALSGDKKTLYWTNLTGNTLYSLSTDKLKDFSLSEEVIKSHIKVETALPSNTDGMTADRDNNVYMSGLTLNGLMKRDGKTGKVSRFVYDQKMIWPDTLAWGPQNYLYVSSNNLHKNVDGRMNFANPSTPNFIIWRMKMDTKAYTAK